jgi:hypothetical protein
MHCRRDVAGDLTMGWSKPKFRVFCRSSQIRLDYGQFILCNEVVNYTLLNS